MLPYSGPNSITLWTTWSARSACVASQPESTTATVTPLPVKPGGAQPGAAHRVGRLRVEELDALVGIDVGGDAADRRLGHRATVPLTNASGRCFIGCTCRPRRCRRAHRRRVRRRGEGRDTHHRAHLWRGEQLRQADTSGGRRRLGVGAQRDRARCHECDPAHGRRNAMEFRELLSSAPAGNPPRAAERYGVRSTFGGGVIGNTAGSGPVVGGSSPPPRATGSILKPQVTRLRLLPRNGTGEHDSHVLGRDVRPAAAALSAHARPLRRICRHGSLDELTESGGTLTSNRRVERGGDHLPSR